MERTQEGYHIQSKGLFLAWRKKQKALNREGRKALGEKKNLYSLDPWPIHSGQGRMLKLLIFL